MKYLTLRNGDLFDEIDQMFAPIYRGNRGVSCGMRTDVIDNGDHYQFDIDLAGVNKDDINLTLDNGYLQVAVEQKEEHEDKQKGYIRRERFIGNCSRTYYVGDVEEKDISANYTDGILSIKVNKQPEKLPEKKQIKVT
ncbi:MAG: Hsp20/alpha crystallin family protein [Clostridia bacterium]|nr:Hsp20/alpha crystallin family protein [Clostridia bacterium]